MLMTRSWIRIGFLAATTTVLPALVFAQATSSQPSDQQAVPIGPLTLDAAIGYAIDHYPTVRAALEHVNASTADIDVARSAYLPRLDAVWQSIERRRTTSSGSCCRSR